MSLCADPRPPLPPIEVWIGDSDDDPGGGFGWEVFWMVVGATAIYVAWTYLS